MRTLAALPLLGALAACHPAPAPTAHAPASTSSAVDSIVLERTPCHGRCPVYRVRLSGAGEVHLRTLAPAAGVSVRRVEPAAVAALAREAERIGFAALPPRVRDAAALCGPVATDHPIAIVTVFAGGGSRRVEDYLGCHGTAPALRALRTLEARIDRVAGTGP